MIANKRVIFERPGGGVSVVIPAAKGRSRVEVVPARIENRVVGHRKIKDVDGNDVMVPVIARVQAPPIYRDETNDEFMARVVKQSVPENYAFHVVDVDDLPADRTFRNAWAYHDGRVEVDMPKAREIHRSHIRKAREPMLLNLDVEYQRADERGDKAMKASVVTRKQDLRDAPAHPDIEAAKTPDDLKRVWPLPA